MDLDATDASSRRAAFEEHRGRLWGVAYRMLGSRADADDMVQEAYLRWHGAPTAEVRTPALAWTEAVTLVADGHVPDDVYAEVSLRFTEQEVLALTLAVIAINGFNRLNVAFRVEGGSYTPGMFDKLHEKG